jgi:hypothetical protein
MENIPDNHCAKSCRDVIRTDGGVVLTCFSYATNFEYCEWRLVRAGTAQFKIACKSLVLTPVRDSVVPTFLPARRLDLRGRFKPRWRQFFVIFVFYPLFILIL